MIIPMLCVFFSSRRRHTILQGDWSSDVCSSDLAPQHAGAGQVWQAARFELPRVAEQRPHRAQGGAVARLDAEPVEGCHPEGASQILAPQLGVEFPRLALGAQDRKSVV